MSSSTPYRIYVDPHLLKSLLRRFNDLPLKEILQELRNRLGFDFELGKTAPFPYADKVKFQTFSFPARDSSYQVSAVYEVDTQDQVVYLHDVGIQLAE